MIDLGLNEEQTQIVDGAVALLNEHSPVIASGSSGTPADLHRALAEWGWFGLGLAESDGGLGLSIAEETLVYFEAGRFLLSPTALATTLAVHVAAPDLRAKLLDGSAHAAIVLSADETSAYRLDGRDAAALEAAALGSAPPTATRIVARSAPGVGQRAKG